MLPGEVSSQKSYTDVQVSDLLNFVAGTTYSFKLELIDIYSNKITTAKDDEVKIIARYKDHNDYTSPINVDDISNWRELYGSDIVGLATDN